MHQSTRGGSSDTEVKELTVIPIWDASSGAAVITAIPVGNQHSASRKARVSKGLSSSISHPDPGGSHSVKGRYASSARLGETAKRPQGQRVIWTGGGYGQRERG